MIIIDVTIGRMETIIFDGRREAREREEKLKARVAELKYPPRLGSVVFGEDVASQLYTRLKMEAATRVGIEFDRADVSVNDDLEDLEKAVRWLSQREDITGLMVQKPTKEQWAGNSGQSPEDFEGWWARLTAQIDPRKDVDCLTRVNLMKIYEGKWTLLPATVKAILSILEIANSGQWAVDGKVKATIIGRSELVGRPLAAVLERKGYKVALCGSKTLDLASKVGEAEVVVSATGVPGLIRGEWIKPGATVIDVGSPKAEVEFEAAVKRAGFITPVPGGVGPMTVISLLENTMELL